MAAREALSALTRDYPPGTILFEEHDPGSRMFVIRKGRVRIYRRVGTSEIVLAFLGPGDFFGEMALLENLPRSASASVVEDARLVEVDAATFEEMIRGNSEVAVRIMRKLAARLRDSDHRIETLLVEGAAGRAIEVLRWLLPQGKPEGQWVRLAGAAVHMDLAAQAGIPPGAAENVMRQLEASDCLRIEGSDLLIANAHSLDEYAAFLDLKRKYDHPGAEMPAEAATHEKEDERLRAMQRLLTALKLTPEDLESRQQALASQYRRYAELKRRFRTDAPKGS
jgi:CRP/FNR family transcriptional regulator, cyclic AMP receptor protein